MAGIIALQSDPGPETTLTWHGATTNRWVLKTLAPPTDTSTVSLLASSLEVWIATDTVSKEAKVRAGVYRPLGASKHIVLTDATDSPATMTVAFLTLDDDGYFSLVSLLDSRQTLILQAPYGESWRVWVVGRSDATYLLDVSSPARTTEVQFVEVS